MTTVASALKTHPMPSSSSLRSLIVCRDPGPRVTEVGWELRGRLGMSMSHIFPPTPTFWGIHLASKKGIPVFFNAVAFNPRAGCGWCRLPPFVCHNSHLDWGVLECGWIVISTFHDHGIDEVPGDMKEQLATVDAATVSAHQQLTFLCPHRRPNCGEVLTRDRRTSNFISLVSPSLDIAGPNTYSLRQPSPATKPPPIQASPSTGHRKHV